MLLQSWSHMSLTVRSPPYIRTAPVSQSYTVYESGKQPGSKAKSMLQVHCRHICQVPKDLCNHTRSMQGFRVWDTKSTIFNATGQWLLSLMATSSPVTWAPRCWSSRRSQAAMPASCPKVPNDPRRHGPFGMDSLVFVLCLFFLHALTSFGQLTLLIL